MKNVLITCSLFVVCVAGAVVGAGIYFGLVFGALASLVGTGPSSIAQPAGALAAGLGLPLGGLVFYILTWPRLVRGDGRPDSFLRGLAVILGGILSLGWLTTVEPALAAADFFDVPGFFAVVGFASLAGWLERKFRLA